MIVIISNNILILDSPVFGFSISFVILSNTCISYVVVYPKYDTVNCLLPVDFVSIVFIIIFSLFNGISSVLPLL